MEVFIMPIGSPGNVDIAWTITRFRTRHEVLDGLPLGAPERPFFDSDQLDKAFPDGRFNCWGIPDGAEQRFKETHIGDVVLFFPTTGANGGLAYLGLVKAKCPIEAWDASAELWPRTEPIGRLYPYLFFFHTETGGFRAWADFLDDVGYMPNWNPHGNYRPIRKERFAKFGGPSGYVDFLRNNMGFVPLK